MLKNNDFFAIFKSENSKSPILSFLNINSVRNKFDHVMSLIDGNLDFIALVETKIDQTFRASQFAYNWHVKKGKAQKRKALFLAEVRTDIPSI